METLVHNNNTFKDLAYQLYKHISDKHDVLKNNYPSFIIKTKCPSDHILGPTAYYDPNKKCITVYTYNRHPKDILRSFSHEVIHHLQNCENRLTNIETKPGYMLDNDNMAELEREAYEKGNMYFREFEDLYKRKNLLNENDTDMYNSAVSKIPNSIQRVGKKINQRSEFEEAFSTWFKTLDLSPEKINISTAKTLVGQAMQNLGYK